MILGHILYGCVKIDLKMEDPNLSTTDKIKEYYDGQAREWALDFRSTINDPNERRLEIKAISKYFKDQERVLEIGCGNGCTAVGLVKKYNLSYFGVDFSSQLIEVAKRQKENNKSRLKGSLDFNVANVLALPFGETEFDKVLSERCLINLPSWEEQKKAILQISRVLKPKGVFVMVESFAQGKAMINSLRQKYSLAPIPIKWFNLYFNESQLLGFIQPYFKLVKIDYFNSVYYLITRVFYPALLKRFNREPSYGSKVNRMVSFLPNFGRFGYIRLYAFKKK